MCVQRRAHGPHGNSSHLAECQQINPQLSGSTHIYSDCLGALKRVAELPPERIPTRCRHSDILKNILVNCSGLTSDIYYSHVKAHQDDDLKWNEMTRPAQLNTACDSKAKSTNRQQDITNLPKQQPFPPEPMCLFIDGEKMTSDTGSHVRYAAHKCLAREFFNSYKVLFPNQFDEVDWKNVNHTLTDCVPRLFQVWACK